MVCLFEVSGKYKFGATPASYDYPCEKCDHNPEGCDCECQREDE